MKSVLDIQTWINEFGEGQVNLDKLEEYLNFIKEVQSKSFSKDDYTEWHHIVPKCVDKEKKYRDQGVGLSGSDHLRAHLLLVDSFSCNTYRRSLSYAVRQMSRDPLGARKLSPDEYEEVRKKFSEGVTGTKMFDEARRKISETLSEDHPRFGKHHSQETKDKISSANKAAWTEDKRKEFSERRKGAGNPCYGKKRSQKTEFSEEARERMSLSGKGKVWINNGEVSTKISQGQEIPEGWTRGRLSFKRSSNGQKGKVWIVNSEGCSRKITKDSPIPEGFQKGRVWRSLLED